MFTKDDIIEQAVANMINNGVRKPLQDLQKIPFDYFVVVEALRLQKVALDQEWEDIIEDLEERHDMDLKEVQR